MKSKTQKQLVAQIDKTGHIIGPIEKSEAHQQGTLHRGLSTVLRYKNYYILQHRKQPPFDGLFDLSYSSHPVYKRSHLEEDEDAVFNSLKRKWKLDKTDIIGQPKNIGVIYHKSKDEKGKSTEHEMSEQYVVRIKKLPNINLNYMYGYSLVTPEELQNKRSEVYKHLTPRSKKTVNLL